MGNGFLVLEGGEIFEGDWVGHRELAGRAGEVVFNTSHAGYEEIATDPSYFSQIVVMTAPMQGNYGVDRAAWESRHMWIEGFVSLDLQRSERDSSWGRQLLAAGIPVLTGLDTRAITLRLRNLGTVWGALVFAPDEVQAREMARGLIEKKRLESADWAYSVSRREREVRKGHLSTGPRVAILDFGCKENTLRELDRQCSEIAVFPSRTSERVIRDWNPNGLLLSNGPGDPAEVLEAAKTVQALLGSLPIMGICMGHQILATALGAKTYKLKFGHRGANHPVKDHLLDEIYVTSQNHGYAVDEKTLPTNVLASHINLNDQTNEGLECQAKRCFSVQYHPESHPGPREARRLFEYFLTGLSN